MMSASATDAVCTNATDGATAATSRCITPFTHTHTYRAGTDFSVARGTSPPPRTISHFLLYVYSSLLSLISYFSFRFFCCYCSFTLSFALELQNSPPTSFLPIRRLSSHTLLLHPFLTIHQEGGLFLFFVPSPFPPSSF